MRSIKKWLALGMCVSLAAGLAGCSSTAPSGTQGNNTASAEGSKSGESSKGSENGKASGVKTIRIANGQPEDHPENIALYAFKDFIEERLGDKYTVEIYPNELMGGSAQALELMQSGSLEMVIASTSNLEAFSNTYKIFGLPYLFDSLDSYYKVMDTEEFINKIYSSTVDSGIQGVAWFSAGTRSFYSPKKIESPADLKGKKVRVQSSDTNVKMVEALGGAAVILSYGEVYTALQNGVIDVAESPEIALVSHKHGEVAKFYSYDEHQIMPDMLVASPKFMSSLSEEEKAVFEEGFKMCSEKERVEWDVEIDAVKEKALEMGVEFVDVDKEPFKELLLPVTQKVLEENPDLKPLYDEIKQIQEN